MTASNPDPARRPGPVGDWEELGRRIFSSSTAKKAAKNRVPLHLFLEDLGVKELSVDRTTAAEPDGIAEVVADAQKAAKNRPSPPNTFCGWAVVSAEAVRNTGCLVNDSPLCKNRYHADVILPDTAMENKDAQRGYATTLAGISRWKPWPY
jgi:hypothetical protein